MKKLLFRRHFYHLLQAGDLLRRLLGLLGLISEVTRLMFFLGRA